MGWRPQMIADQAIGFKQQRFRAYLVTPELRRLLRVHVKRTNQQLAQIQYIVPDGGERFICGKHRRNHLT